MKNLELNPLNNNQKKFLQFGVIALLFIFLVAWFLFNRDENPIISEKNTTVYIEDSTLHAFDDTYDLSKYPNRVSVHLPYLLVIQPGEQKTVVYDLDNKEKVEEFNESLLDYYNDRQLKNIGRSTFLDDLDLGVLCEKGLIKNDQEVLCLTKVSSNNVENKLISIDIPSKIQKDIYVSKDLITDFNLIGDKVYIGEISLFNKQNYLIIDAEKIEVPSIVNLIYEMGGRPYFATLKGELSSNDIYYQIENDRISKIESNVVKILK